MKPNRFHNYSRRNFLGFALPASIGTVLTACLPQAAHTARPAATETAAPPPMKVKEVVDAIITACAVGTIPDTCDRLITGDMEAEVTGLVTTFMATPEVIRAAAERGANLIITHEPSFYNDTDNRERLLYDPVYLAKLALIKETGMNIWRFHDYIHSLTPDLIFHSLARDLGWVDYVSPDNKFVYTIPATTVPALAQLLKKRLGIKEVRVVGGSDVKVEKVGMCIGGISTCMNSDTLPMELLRENDLDVIVAGDVLEWLLCSYVRDAAQLGLNKAMIIAGHNSTEEAGMKYLPEWLANVLPDLPAFFIASGDPYSYL